ncbi:phosphatidate cytidylyltransferase [Ponticaulis sp.]|uniref:phosphatidate cytidylyltransferase n=1 Tax=Ponticaulis sp. TaxID=2020902 RepID=UPI000C52DB3C|nr:phosphatidate cytidylyltransferase [Ponticaulis sp.]MAJ08290.1 phosphatidate cytidylyltransferase [Ponticaulis sp.]HBH88577.1 phosphatidate cytidylyltransferase [Hyphomonadaceae bacterium]|tara:strand:- start:25046 stop:25879 length:834 start_codon:yes stop_codon:yes gene_type:complete
MNTPDPRRGDTLSLRVVSAALMIPAGLFVVWCGGVVLLAAGLACALLMWREVWIVTTERALNYVAHVVAAGLLIAISIAYFQLLPSAAIAALFCILAYITIRTSGVSSAIWLVGGGLIIGLAVNGLLELRARDDGRLYLTLIVMSSVWITDIAAYFAGRGFGGPQLAPRNSPNKTWSGAAGAVICTALFGALSAGLMQGHLTNWIIYIGLVSAIAQLGDLAESRWKRTFGVKDSGNIIPGHGGILDRLDSFSAVLVAHAIAFSIDPSFPEHALGLGR